jgi:phage terminase large subunit-like protein
MALTDAQRQQNVRDRKAGRPETFGEEYKARIKASKEEIEAFSKQHLENYLWAQEQDTGKRFFKSECRPCVDLLGVYEGGLLNDEDEEEEDDKKGKKKKQVIPNPSRQKIVIRAIETEMAGVSIKLEPDCAPEFRALNEVDEIVSFQRWLDLRAKARRDLFWLGRMLGKGLYHSSHQSMCDKFVNKNFEGLYFPDYNIDDFHAMFKAQKRFANLGTDVVPGVTETREMVLLEPRSSYKSTIDGIDCVSWMINAPDVRIMLITGVKKLSQKFVREVKGYFYLSPRGTPTPFQLLFPEYILTGVEGRSEMPLYCPAAKFHQKEANLWYTSIESCNTGDHCDILKADDVVTPENSTDEELRETLKYNFDGTDDIRDPWGFTDVCGTRYFTTDWYGTRQRPDEDTGEVAPVLFSSRGSWILDAERVEDYKAGRLSLRDIISLKCGKLLFPFKLDWKELRKILNKKGQRSFKNQQLNEATDSKEDDAYINHFDEDVLRAHILGQGAEPKVGNVFQTWDIAYSERRTSDWSVGVTGIIYQNKKNQYALCILDMIFDKWKSSELSFHILQFYKKWSSQVQSVYIEKTNGSTFLFDNLKIAAGVHQVPDIIDKIGQLRDVDNTSNAKSNRVKSLEILLADDRLHFAKGLWIDETFKQLTQYTGQKSSATRKDDIPDAMSFLIKFMPRGSIGPTQTDPAIAEREMEIQAMRERLKAQHAAMFGTSVLPPAVLASQLTGRNEPKQPTALVEEPKTDPRSAAMQKLFGGNGMRA